ncbi:hypothetical protein, partial [Mycobacterium sp.]|uniref:hypothetical protein n=1 Tax=Mycobacterium sp. TaxID=1785 RepID=UPI0012794F48
MRRLFSRDSAGEDGDEIRGQGRHRHRIRWRRSLPSTAVMTHPDESLRLGYIGLGNMGAPMAKRLAG